MNLILAIPLELRLAGLFVLGVCAGSLVNLGVYRLAWHPRPISPWSPPPADAPRRRWDDRIPVFGWLGLRREAGVHGTCFWIRPMLVEILVGIGFALLYWWEIEGLTEQLAIIRPDVKAPPPVVLHAQYVCHLVLVLLMLVGSLIDVDEKIIPDAVTLPGTLFALLAAAVYPWSLLPDQERVAGRVAGMLWGAPRGPFEYDFLRLTSPNPWPAWLEGSPNLAPLLIALGCWWLWCVALMHRTWYSRHGCQRALVLMWARLVRESSTWRIGLMGLVGSAGIAGVWLWGGGPHWHGLLSALVGLAASGGLVWIVRIVGTAVLRREAMGFGDVTLMAMIGAFLGWQTCLIVFFLAPFAGLLVGLFNVVFHRQTEIPYGPFLCLAAVFAIVRWVPLWKWAEAIFLLGAILPLVLLVCMALMAVMLAVWRMMRRTFE